MLSLLTNRSLRQTDVTVKHKHLHQRTLRSSSSDNLAIWWPLDHADWHMVLLTEVHNVETFQGGFYILVICSLKHSVFFGTAKEFFLLVHCESLPNLYIQGPQFN